MLTYVSITGETGWELKRCPPEVTEVLSSGVKGFWRPVRSGESKQQLRGRTGETGFPGQIDNSPAGISLAQHRVQTRVISYTKIPAKSTD